MSAYSSQNPFDLLGDADKKAAPAKSEKKKPKKKQNNAQSGGNVAQAAASEDKIPTIQEGTVKKQSKPEIPPPVQAPVAPNQEKTAKAPSPVPPPEAPAPVSIAKTEQAAPPPSVPALPKHSPAPIPTAPPPAKGPSTQPQNGTPQPATIAKASPPQTTASSNTAKGLTSQTQPKGSQPQTTASSNTAKGLTSQTQPAAPISAKPQASLHQASIPDQQLANLKISATRATTTSSTPVSARDAITKLEKEAANVTADGHVALWTSWLSALDYDQNQYYDDKDHTYIGFRNVLLRSKAINNAIISLLSRLSPEEYDIDLHKAISGVFDRCCSPSDPRNQRLLVSGLLEVISKARQMDSRVPSPVVTAMATTLAAWAANVSHPSSFFQQLENLDQKMREEEGLLCTLDRTAPEYQSRAVVHSRALLSCAESKLRDFEKRSSVFRRDQHIRSLFSHLEKDLGQLAADAERVLATTSSRQEELVRIKDEVSKSISSETMSIREKVISLNKDERELQDELRKLEREMERIKRRISDVAEERRRLELENQSKQSQIKDATRSYSEQTDSVVQQIMAKKRDFDALDCAVKFVTQIRTAILDELEGTSPVVKSLGSTLPVQYIQYFFQHVRLSLDVVRGAKAIMQICAARLAPLRVDLYDVSRQGLSMAAEPIQKSIESFEQLAKASMEEARRVQEDINSASAYLAEVLAKEDSAVQAQATEVKQLLQEMHFEMGELMAINSLPNGKSR